MAQISEMNWWQALILGMVQGLGEYLPISSSGHLAIAQRIFGLQVPLNVDILLHLATLIPTIWVFRTKVLSLLRSFFFLLVGCHRLKKQKTAEDGRYIVVVLIATVCTFLTAFPQRNLNLKAQPMLVATAFLVTAATLLLQHVLLQNRSKNLPKISGDASPRIFALDNLDNLLLSSSLTKAILLAACIGMAQGVAAIPGISRSGMTISIALLLGIQSRAAGEFSFMISIPVIIGAFLLDVKEISVLLQFNSSPQTAISIVLAFFVALISGFLALRILLALLRKNKFHLFAPYLIVLAVFSFRYFV